MTIPLYAHKKFLVDAVQLTEKVTKYNANGKVIGLPGEYLLKDQLGEYTVLTKDYFEEYYQPVKKFIDKEQMARGYMEMAEINLEEANAGVYTYGEGFTGDNGI